MRYLLAAAAMAALTQTCVSAQTTNPCRGVTLAGTVRDSTAALIPDATLALNGRIQHSGGDGRYQFACVSDGSHHLTVTASGFEQRTLNITLPRAGALDVVLKPQAVEAEVQVDGSDAASAPSATSAGPSQTLSGTSLQSLADDPDDLLRELQQLAALAGGNPQNTTIAVDGFQDATALPPKGSIAYIKVNPDLFSAEYREPPFEGGRVEVYTKPGQKVYHGALFLTNGSPWENARDPFSTAKAALGKQRYGFELTGPVRKVGSDFALTLEHRSIDNFAVVNAVTLNSAGATVPVLANVATPQRLWLGTVRLDWQLGAKNTALLSYSANVNHLVNQGVGGTALAETGYDTEKYEHVIRTSDITLISAHVMHEARVSFSWNGYNDLPASTAPQVQVAGAFTGGGSALGAKQVHRFNVEFDDDAIITTRNHTLKLGGQMFVYDEHQLQTLNFNGSYTFGGGTAPVLDANGNPVAGQTTTITGIEQYRRAQLGLPGGNATAYTAVTGTPKVDFVQTQDAFFVQDDWNIGHGVHVAAGLRYFVQNDPVVLAGITPRLGVLWSPSKQGTWTLHAHAGLFTGQYGEGDFSEVLREDGVSRVTSTVYNPVYGSPFAGATPIHSMREFSPHLSNISFAIENIGGTRALPHGWNLSADLYIARIWNEGRSININSPLNGLPTGPRPGAPNLNLFAIQNTGQGRANVEFFGLEQHTLKHVRFFVGAVHAWVVDDSDDNELGGPQSAFSNAGELGYRSNQTPWSVFGNGTYTFPGKLQLSTDLSANGDGHYNITTGFDNNGDGNFNDRPQYAAPGTPGAIATRYGLLVASGGQGVFPRNKGVLPWTVHLDMNLQRAFTLTRNQKADHQQTLTFNVRSSNVLNHVNVTSVGGVLGSPLFGVPYAADNGRRVEAGARYSF
jgi:hypothetical protein